MMGFALRRKKNGLRLKHHKPLTYLARPAGFEPATPWFVGGSSHLLLYVNQPLATPANLLLSLVQSQLWHMQSQLDTLGTHLC